MTPEDTWLEQDEEFHDWLDDRAGWEMQEELEQQRYEQEQKMGLTAKQTGGDYENPPDGTHLGICYMIVDCGLHFNPQFNNRQHKFLVGWELPDEKMSDGRPFAVSKEYTLSLNEKANLFQDLTSWRGRAFSEEELEAFEVFNVLGAPAFLSVINKVTNAGSTWPRVQSVSKIPKGTQVPELTNPKVTFSLEDGDDIEQSDLPDWIKKKVMLREHDNWDAYEESQADSMEKAIDEARTAEMATGDDWDDDIPF